MAVINQYCLGGLEITELTLGLPGGGGSSRSLEIMKINEKKRVFSEIINDGLEEGKSSSSSSTTKESKMNHHHHQEEGGGGGGGGAVVGWPPVCSYRRKNSFNNNNNNIKKKKIMIKYVKVSMDGAPFLRKLDLSAYKQYSHLLFALQNLFGYSFCEDALKEKDGVSSIISSDYYYVPIYEDKDGDWMLVGDVPWNMFTESCKRLRIMKKTEAKKGINNISSSNSADLFIHS